MDSILLLRQTPVRWVSVLERNTFCSFSGVDPAISPRTTIRSFLRSGLFAAVNTEQVSFT